MNKLILKQEVLDAYDGYVKTFIKGDKKEVENFLSFPNFRFLDGEIKEFNKFHSNLNELKNRGYKDTIALSIDVVEINEEKAHLVLKEALRVKDNNEPLEQISSFYIFIKEDNKWKIKFSSAFFFPKKTV
jgi:hypothetical protein